MRPWSANKAGHMGVNTEIRKTIRDVVLEELAQLQGRDGKGGRREKSPRPVVAAAGSPLLLRDEAAALCRISLRSFERHVRRYLTVVDIGGRTFFRKEDVLQWLEARKVGPLSATDEREST